MDYNELLFVAEVRRLALELRNSEWQIYSRTPEKYESYSESGARAQDQSEWIAEHPLEPYLLRAVGLIRDAATYLRTLPAE
jgi:hypothetical protein